MKFGFSALLPCLLFGCAYQPTPTSDTFKPFNFAVANSAVKRLEKQAQFDFSCPQGDLTYKILGPKLVGVEGCEAKKRYRYVSEVGWVDDEATGLQVPLG